MVAGTDKSETVFVSDTAQHQSQPPAWVSPQALGMQLLQAGSSWSLTFITTSVGVFTGAGVTGRLQCRDKSLNESEPLTGEHYLVFPGRIIRRKSLEESRVSEFAADFPVLTNVWHSLGSTPTFVDMRSTAHSPALLRGVSPLQWQKSFVAFQLNNFFFLREFCLKQFVFQEMKPNNRRDQDVCIRTTLILSDFVRSRLVYFNVVTLYLSLVWAFMERLSCWFAVLAAMLNC